MSCEPAVEATPGRTPRWFEPAHQADITAAFDALPVHGATTHTGTFAAVAHAGHHSHAARAWGPPPHRVRELGRLAAASTLPARAALLRWGALPAVVRQELLTRWYGHGVAPTAALDRLSA